ncbi:MAG TPA: calcium/sodium antiporter [Thermoanaerobaculia bacterium]|jgi:cation:H+ antiporter
MLLAILLLFLGVGLLYAGGDLLVDNSIRLAKRFNVSNMVVGLTVVAFGTSCPELAASMAAALSGSPDIAIGNVFGSNVANLGLILGLSALILPFTVTAAFLRREVAFMVFATLLVYPLMVGGRLGRLEGLVLFLLLLGFVYVLLRHPGAEDEHMVAASDLDAKTPRPIWLASLGVLVGVGLLVAGAKALVSGAVTIATAMGVSERVVGFTVVALGTSLPELAASVVAARRGEGDIVMGNLVGSNIFNLLCILGLTALVVPIPVSPASMGVDFGMMLGTAVLLAVFLAWNRRLSRLEGAVLVLVYLGCTWFLYS